MNKFPMLPQPQQNVLSTLNTNYFERVTNLIVWLVDRKKQARYILVGHQLLNNIIKTVLKVYFNDYFVLYFLYFLILNVSWEIV